MATEGNDDGWQVHTVDAAAKGKRNKSFTAPTFVMTSEHRKRGAKRSRYTIKAKIAVVEYSLQADPNGQGPGKTIGAQEAARCYLISD